jgi:hypothetical protein
MMNMRMTQTMLMKSSSPQRTSSSWLMTAVLAGPRLRRTIWRQDLQLLQLLLKQQCSQDAADSASKPSQQQQHPLPRQRQTLWMIRKVTAQMAEAEELDRGRVKSGAPAKPPAAAAAATAPF